MSAVSMKNFNVLVPWPGVLSFSGMPVLDWPNRRIELSANPWQEHALEGPINDYGPMLLIETSGYSREI
jgi:hypothetical protein